MKSSKASIDKIIDGLITSTNDCFYQLLCATTLYQLGQLNVDQLDNNVKVSVEVGLNLQIEPIPIRDIRSFRSSYPSFLIEIFHSRLVQLWQDSLDRLFVLFVDLHFANKRQFVELGKQNVSIDLRNLVDPMEQIKNGLVADFRFREYSERIKTVNKILDPQKTTEVDLQNIYKNILLRNTIQHRSGIIDAYILDKLGQKEIVLRSMDGTQITYKAGDSISLTIPELFSFKQSMLSVGQTWRT